MEKVIIESPYLGDIKMNEEYARKCMKDSLMRGESPFLSHLLYTQVLDDEHYGERCLGISAGINWYSVADTCVVYIDHGISGGMMRGIETAFELKIPIEFRSLDEEQKILEQRFEYG